MHISKRDVNSTRDGLDLMRSHTTYRLKLLVMKTISKPLIVRQPTFMPVIGPFTRFVSPLCIIVVCLPEMIHMCQPRVRY